MILSGYAALFGVPDLSGDVVRAGAARASLARMGYRVPMLLAHDVQKVAGFWRAKEDGRGLFVEGALDTGLPGGRAAARAVERGTDGLSIGFRARLASHDGQRRTLIEIDLLEVSIVALPMQPLARLSVVRGEPRAVL
jgi:HK97 family phage prohead protease